MQFRGRVPSGILGTLVLCCSTAVLTAATSDRPAVNTGHYPDWFVRTPAVSGVRLAVGYSPTYGDTAVSVREARSWGFAAMRVTHGVRVRAEYLQEILRNGTVEYRGESFEEDTLSPLDTSGVVADRAFLPRMVLALIASDSLSLVGRRIPFAARPPKWTELTPTSPDGLYAVGTAAAHFDEQYSWKEAERQARRTMAFATRTRLRSAIESRTGGSANGALIASTATELRDVEVKERWRDSRRMFVLIHARVVSTKDQ